jgi:outer membrane receptor for ferrienterochelin and colicins
MDTQINNHAILAGITYRKTYYDDNTVATQFSDSTRTENRAQNIDLPGVFFQDEIELKNKQSLLFGLRYDHHKVHGSIFSPRIAYIKNFSLGSSVRVNLGKGFRVVNLFTEDHAALTGARTVVIKNELKPENSYNASVSLMHKISGSNRNLLTIELNNFYTYFDNRIIADYSDPNKIQYDNLSGYSISRGANLNLEYTHQRNWLATLGVTVMDVYAINNQKKIRPLLTERFSGTWSLTRKIKKILVIDYTGNLYSPMLLPTLGSLDPRPKESPWWSIQNLKFTYDRNKQTKLFFGVKNILNWTPWKSAPFIIARANDPFDKQITTDANGQILATPNNPYALSFDPSYVYAPNQGRRLFIGFNYTF